jgi:tetratricopeptide (TPR) repeat protein
MFLRGRVATNDSTALPNDAAVERICNTRVRQKVYAASNGDFSMQLGSMADSFLDATSDPAASDIVAGKDAVMGIPRRELANCELRASASGFRSREISLLGLTTFSGAIDVGSIVVQRTAKVEGMTLSATPYNAPKAAIRAYEKGIAAEKNGKPADARKYFEQAVQIYPKYASAWFKLGSVLQKEHEYDDASAAYLQATAINTKFLPPYLSLAAIAYELGNWKDVLQFTGHILDLDPLNQANVTGYIVDLDPLNYADAYYYNAVAYFQLNKTEEAEKSALKAAHLDLRTHFPQLHLLLAEIAIRKNDYATAVSETQTYLQLAPHAKDADHVREQLAKLQRLNSPVSAGEKPDQN